MAIRKLVSGTTKAIKRAAIAPTKKPKKSLRPVSKNPNRPQPGSIIRVEPIRSLEDIKTIKTLLKDNPRDLVLFTIGINTNLRASDLLAVKAGQVRHLQPNGHGLCSFTIREKKTRKVRTVYLNPQCMAVIKDLLASQPFEDDDFLFRGRGRNSPLTIPTFSQMVKNWCRKIDLRGNYASHTLRKTWGFHQRVTYGRGLPELMVCFNHATQRQTLRYLGIDEDEVQSVFSNIL